MPLIAERVRETSTTNGTGTLDLDGALTAFQTFVAGVGDGNRCYYAIGHRSADEWEVGIGTVTDASPDTLSRDTVLESSNADALVSLSAGTKDVFVSPPVDRFAPTGSMMDFGGSSAPPGWLICDGTAVSRTTFKTLFGVIGETFGVGDGSTTFNLPDRRGRTSVGVGTGDAADATAHALADKEGGETHTLIVSEMPSHNHDVPSGTAGGSGAVAQQNFDQTGTWVTFIQGGDGAHNNLQPSLTVNVIIAI